MASYSRWVEASPDELLAEVAVHSLATRLDAVRDFLEKAATKADENVEHVHQMRVWSRRAAAALQLYESLMPAWRVKRLAKHLKRIRRAANDARDDDVFAQRLAKDQADPGACLLLDKVRLHRCRVQEPIAAMHRKLNHGDRLARRNAKLLKHVGKGRRAEIGAIRFGDWARERLNQQVDEFFAAAEGDLSDTDSLHRLRIAGKNLRYTMELLAPAFATALRSQIYPMTKDLQDRLGEINDHATAQQRLRRWIEEAGTEASRAYLQKRLIAESDSAARLRNEFLAWWNGSRADELRGAFAEVLGPVPVV